MKNNENNDYENHNEQTGKNMKQKALNSIDSGLIYIAKNLMIFSVFATGIICGLTLGGCSTNCPGAVSEVYEKKSDDKKDQEGIRALRDFDVPRFEARPLKGGL